MISKTTLYKVQNKYVFPVIHNTWHNHQKQVLQIIKEQKVQINVVGDGRCDSLGHSAKYGTYSLLDESSGKVTDFSLVQVWRSSQHKKYLFDAWLQIDTWPSQLEWGPNFQK